MKKDNGIKLTQKDIGSYIIVRYNDTTQRDGGIYLGNRGPYRGLGEFLILDNIGISGKRTKLSPGKRVVNSIDGRWQVQQKLPQRFPRK